MILASSYKNCLIANKVTARIAALLFVICSFSGLAIAEEPPYTTVRTARFTLHIQRSEPLAQKQMSPDQISESALAILNSTHAELSKVFQVTPSKEVVLRFLSPQEFQKQTGAPAWTSAMFFKNEITIPLNAAGIDPIELQRALRHEYVHAVIAEISDYHGPAWLDEGIAQIIEGDPNPLLGPALRKWLIHNDPIPLDWLHGGFTTLENELVPAAYAQSLFASRLLLAEHGYPAITKYFQLLGSGAPEFKAFQSAFGMPKRNFEVRLKREMLAWMHSGQQQP